MAGISFVNITTSADISNEAYKSMLSSLPRGKDVELVSLITFSDERQLKKLVETDENDLFVSVYEVGIGKRPSLAVARTIVEQLARYNWCFWIDSDDILITPERVIDCVNQAQGGIGAYYCHVVGMQSIDGQATVLYHVEQPRLYRRGAGKWIGYMHEVLKIEGWLTAKANIILEHHGYLCTARQQRERLLRNIRGVALTINECWDDEALREHYMRVMKDNIEAYVKLMSE